MGMVSVAQRNLLEEKSRFAISVSGLALAIVLILLLSGIFNSISASTAAYFDKTNADVWVGQKGSPAAGLASLLPTGLQPELKVIQGVLDVNEILISRSFVKAGNSDASVTLVGYNTTSGVGGPWSVIRGSSKPGAAQVVIDKTFARIYGFTVGSSIDILGQKFEVAGLSDGTNLLFTSYVFMNLNDLSTLIHLKSVVSYYLVTLADPYSSTRTASRISNALDVAAFTKQEVTSANVEAAGKTTLPILFVMDAVGFVVGTFVIGLTIFTLAVEKTQEYAVLRAIGARNSALVRIVFEQVVIIALVGFSLGALLSVVAAFLLEYFVPQVSIAILPETLGLSSLLTLGIGVLSSYLPIRRITKVDPAVVFRR